MIMSRIFSSAEPGPQLTWTAMMPSIIRTLYRFAKISNAQLFLSTHSMECLKAFLPAMKGNEDDFTLLRIDKQNGYSSVFPVEGKFFEAAIQQGFEMR